MSLRLYLARFKALFYAPGESLRTLLSYLNGNRSRLVKAVKECRTDEDHWNFAATHLQPCQKPSEILRFLAWARREAPQVVVEIGVARSGTSYLLTQCLPSLRYYLGIDFFPMNKWLLRAAARPGLVVEHLRGDSNKEEMLGKARRSLGDKQIDLLFIDGNHAYEAVKRDWQLYAPLVRTGGWIAFHDIRPALKTADGRYVNDIEIEVHRLWSDIKSLSVTHEFVEDEGQHCYGIGVWQKIST